MSILRYPLLSFPIHHYSYKEYYERHVLYVEKEKKWVEKGSPGPFDEFSEGAKFTWEETWWWPPWKFNDIVGYLEVGMDIGRSLTGDIYLKRKYFPKDRRERRFKSTKRNNEIIYYSEINRMPVRQNTNEAYVEALENVLVEARKKLKKRNRKFRLWLLPFDLKLINFVEAHLQAMKRDVDD